MRTPSALPHHPARSFAVLGLAILMTWSSPGAEAILGCSGAQHSHPWHVEAGAALSACAHALDATDAIVAHQYTVDSHVLGADLDQLDTRYRSFVTTRRIARESLIAAEAAISTAARVQSARSICEARVAIRTSADALRHVGDALALVGVTDAPALAVTVTALVDVMAANPTCTGGV